MDAVFPFVIFCMNNILIFDSATELVTNNQEYNSNPRSCKLYLYANPRSF